MQLGWPEGLTFYKLLTDWGSIIGGVFALIAGAAAYVAGCMQAKATRQAADKQVAAMTRRDREEAQGIIVGIYPELLEMKAKHMKAERGLANGLSPESMEDAQAFAREMAIMLPPHMARNIDRFFLIYPGRASLLQLASVSGQYNRMLDIIAGDPNRFNFEHLAGHMEAIGKSLDEATREVEAQHDRAVHGKVL